MTKLLNIFFFFLIINFSKAQDVHFSQLNNVPLIINPANTGEYQGYSRFILNYRNQWRSISKNSFETYSFSYDANFFKDKFSSGIYFFKDVAGDGNMSNSQINFSLASKVNLNSSNYLKLGLQTAWGQKSVDMSNLTWNSQYEGSILNSNLISGENESILSFNYIDFSSGLLWNCKMNKNSKLNIGFSAYHINRPKYNFLSDAEKLHIRWNTHIDFEIEIPTTNMTIFPSILFMKQGASNELNFGGIVKYSLGNNSRYTGFEKPSSIYLGLFCRNSDALIAYSRFNFRNQIDIALSYDINLSNFLKFTSARGGMEIALIYTLERNKTNRKYK